MLIMRGVAEEVLVEVGEEGEVEVLCHNLLLGDGKTTDMWFAEFKNEFESRILERDSQEALGGDGVSSEQSDNNIFLEVVGGVDKKKRIFGLGPEGQNQFSSSTQSARVSMSEYMQMKIEHMEMKAENQSLREQMSGIQANQEKLFKFMEAFYQNHPRPPSPPPSPTNEEGQQNDDEYFDELDG